MTSHEDAVVGVVALNGGEIVGRTRLQKTTYLLERSGLAVGFKYIYHNYGPFSVDVADAADLAMYGERLSVEKQFGQYGVPYFTFNTDEDAPNEVGDLTADEVRTRLATMRPYSSLVLELAATIAYLQERKGMTPEEAEREVRLLKPAKATDEFVAKARELLGVLGL